MADFLNIKLTEAEIDLIMDALHAFNPVGTGWEQADLNEVSDDLREQSARHDDGWGDPEDPDLFMDPVDFAAKHDTEPSQIVICDAEINAGVQAREQNKGSSRAAQRRQEQVERMMQGTATPTDPDTWPLNDPADW